MCTVKMKILIENIILNNFLFPNPKMIAVSLWILINKGKWTLNKMKLIFYAASRLNPNRIIKKMNIIIKINKGLIFSLMSNQSLEYSTIIIIIFKIKAQILLIYKIATPINSIFK